MTYLLLSVGLESLVFTTRNAILRQAGFVVHSSSDVEAINVFLSEDFDAVVLCHLIPNQERKQLVQVMKDHKPLTPVAVMANVDGETVAIADATIQPLDGPEELLRQIAEVLVMSQAPRQHRASRQF